MRPKYSGSILVIEDTRFVNSYLKEAFEYRGFTVFQAYTLAEAEAFLEKETFEYIILDLVLPDGDGEKIMATHSDIKTIVLTSDDDSQRRERLFQLGAIDYFSKENPIDYIIRQIDQLFEKFEANHQYHILVVDDSSSVRHIICNTFEMRNFQVSGAESGKKALELLSREHFDLVLLDLHMPDISGEDVLYAIRHEQKQHDLPVIIVSGTSDSDMIARILKHGANEFISKPFSFEELVLKAEIFISMSRTEKIIKKKNKELEEMNNNLRDG